MENLIIPWVLIGSVGFLAALGVNLTMLFCRDVSLTKACRNATAALLCAAIWPVALLAAVVVMVVIGIQSWIEELKK